MIGWLTYFIDTSLLLLEKRWQWGTLICCLFNTRWIKKWFGGSTNACRELRVHGNQEGRVTLQCCRGYLSCLDRIYNFWCGTALWECGFWLGNNAIVVTLP